jgi:hypothetical protein
VSHYANIFFLNPPAITTLHFLTRQLTFLSYASHIIEEQSTCIDKMKIEINKPLLMSQHRKSVSFFTPVVQDQLKESVEEGQIIYEYSNHVADDVSSQCKHVHVNEHYSSYLHTDKTFAAVHQGITSFIILTYSSKSPHVKNTF